MSKKNKKVMETLEKVDNSSALTLPERVGSKKMVVVSRGKLINLAKDMPEGGVFIGVLKGINKLGSGRFPDTHIADFEMDGGIRTRVILTKALVTDLAIQDYETDYIGRTVAIKYTGSKKLEGRKTLQTYEVAVSEE